MHAAPNFLSVMEAAQSLEGYAIKTPLIRAEMLDSLCGCKLYIKAETMQKGGAFKYRGARNRLSQLSPAESKKGVVAFSSGNHAIGVAVSANELGLSALIVMPEDAPKVKVEKVLSYGAEIEFYDRDTQSREAIAADISARTGRTLVPSFDDVHIISGQGTVGVEIAAQCPDVKAVVTGLGGGGLCAGTSLALNQLRPDCRIYGAEPETYNDHQQSLRHGYRVALKAKPPSLCDALLTPQPGELTWPINSKSLSGVFTASDENCLKVMAIVKRELGLIVEPGGAVAIASIMRHKPFEENEFVVAIASGGNVDADILQQALNLY
ncbi:L-threonine ammonia-lyase [Litorimonas taeanensis]|uniref:L-threonine ammonia-lyase n=1 Tax=Litorimonas taeanensis TaxID=568099 RepID=A0A420WK86_9PROT|nr:threonine/serine dehydratase [Litorimonas taeanensis]RKQ71461.1 L-threonine ammonia-lyase [Litorimonas taeanensis]